MARMEPEDECGMPVFKGLIIGEGDSGKVSFMWRHITGGYLKTHIFPRIEAVNSLRFHTTHGPVTFKMLDTRGKERFDNSPREIYSGAQCAILFFDLNSRVTYQKILNHNMDIATYCGNIPVVVCGHSENLTRPKVVWPQKIAARKNWKYYEVCPKMNHNIEKPFVWLAKVLLGDPKLELVPMPAVSPPLITSEAEIMTKLKKGLKNALKHPLPDDDKEDL